MRRLNTNAKLDALALPHLTRPAGRPPAEGYEHVIELGIYQIDSWRPAQRLILVVVGVFLRANELREQSLLRQEGITQ